MKNRISIKKGDLAGKRKTGEGEIKGFGERTSLVAVDSDSQGPNFSMGRHAGLILVQQGCSISVGDSMKNRLLLSVVRFVITAPCIYAVHRVEIDVGKSLTPPSLGRLSPGKLILVLR